MPLTVRTTLCEIRDDLHALRRTVAARGQIETIQAIDALIGVAEGGGDPGHPAHRSGRLIFNANTFNEHDYRREEQ